MNKKININLKNLILNTALKQIEWSKYSNQTLSKILPKEAHVALDFYQHLETDRSYMLVHGDEVYVLMSFVARNFSTNETIEQIQLVVVNKKNNTVDIEQNSAELFSLRNFIELDN